MSDVIVEVVDDGAGGSASTITVAGTPVAPTVIEVDSNLDLLVRVAALEAADLNQATHAQLQAETDARITGDNAIDAYAVHVDTTQTVTGDKNFTGALTHNGHPVLDSTSTIGEDKVTGLTTDLAATVHKAGAESITGDKDFTGALTHGGNAVLDTTSAIPESQVTGLTADLAARVLNSDSRLSDNRHLLADGDTNFGGHKGINVADPTAATDVASKAYVDAVASGASGKTSVRVATTANITLSGTQTIDGVAVVAGDRVLVKDQTTTSQNGIYVAAAGAWARSADADAASEIKPGLYVFVELGTVNVSSGWVNTNDPDVALTLGTTGITFTQFTGLGEVTVANGLSKSGNTIQVQASGLTDAQIATANKDGVAGTPSLRTLGTGAQQATAGNDARLSDARTPTAHAATHKIGGTDPLTTWTTSALICQGTAIVATNVLPPGVRVPKASTITDLWVRVGTAPVGSSLTVAFKKTSSGTTTTIATLSVTAGSTSVSLTGQTIALATGDILTWDITAVGSSTPGSDVVVEVIAP